MSFEYYYPGRAAGSGSGARRRSKGPFQQMKMFDSLENYVRSMILFFMYLLINYAGKMNGRKHLLLVRVVGNYSWIPESTCSSYSVLNSSEKSSHTHTDPGGRLPGLSQG